jgi:hypothetical protein
MFLGLLGKVDRAKDARKRTKDVRDTKTKEQES